MLQDDVGLGHGETAIGLIRTITWSICVKGRGHGRSRGTRR
jgi:hypothetical protein